MLLWDTSVSRLLYYLDVHLQVKEYVNDPLIYHGGLKARFIYEFMNAVGNARSSVHSISLPLFLMHGDEDRLVPISASEFIQRNIGSESKTYEVCN